MLNKCILLVQGGIASLMLAIQLRYWQASTPEIKKFQTVANSGMIEAEMLDIALLGTGGMIPLKDRWLASLMLRYNGKLMLIDCGESTQIPLQQTGWGCKSIDIVCITHYHADHVAGLPGLLLTIGNCGRRDPVTIYGPVGLRNIINGLSVIFPELPFELNMIELPHSFSSVSLGNNLTLRSAPAEHSLPCLAYSIELKRPGKFDARKAELQKIPMKYWKLLQNGEEVHLPDADYQPQMVLGEERKGLKVTYCTDTRPADALEVLSEGSDLLVCEGIYGQDEYRQKAMEKKHMIFSEAAELARSSHAKELWLTHFSPSMKNPAEYLHYAADIFPNVTAGTDLMTKTLHFSE